MLECRLNPDEPPLDGCQSTTGPTPGGCRIIFHRPLDCGGSATGPMRAFVGTPLGGYQTSGINCWMSQNRCWAVAELPPAARIANRMHNEIFMDTIMSLTCSNMPVFKIDRALLIIKDKGIRNILALKGAPQDNLNKLVFNLRGVGASLAMRITMMI